MLVFVCIYISRATAVLTAKGEPASGCLDCRIFLEYLGSSRLAFASGYQRNLRGEHFKRKLVLPRLGASKALRALNSDVT